MKSLFYWKDSMEVNVRLAIVHAKAALCFSYHESIATDWVTKPFKNFNFLYLWVLDRY